MAEDALIQHVHQVSDLIARQFAGNPRAELRCWLRIAHQREAMAVQLYDPSSLRSRFDAVPSPAIEVIASTIVSIWAHEQSHTRLLGSLRSLQEPFPALTELLGELEGQLVRNVAGGGVLGRTVIAIGAALSQVPDFAKSLGEMSLHELLKFYAALEATACTGYERILQLVNELRGDAEVLAELGLTFKLDLCQIILEESFHYRAFGEMVNWLRADGSAAEPAPATTYVAILYRLAQSQLSMQTLRQLVGDRSALESDDPSQTSWVSDAGFGELFAKFGFEVPLANPGRSAVQNGH